MNYRRMNQDERDNALKKDLNDEKIKLIEKYGLSPTPDLKWLSRKENAHDQVVFTHRFARRADIIGILFRVNRLCLAKVKYFRENRDKFKPHVYEPLRGFEPTDWWNADFLKHVASGTQIDLRYLMSITDIAKFREFCAYLESFEEERTRADPDANLSKHGGDMEQG